MACKIFNKRNSFSGLFLFFCISVLGQNKYEFSHPQMGTMFKIVLYANDSLSAVYASQKAFLRLDELNLILSDYREDSEINQLCRTAGSGQSIKVSDDLWGIMQASVKAAQLSQNNFDITIGPLVQLWRRMKRQKELPSTNQIDEARTKVGIEHIVSDAATQSILLKKQGMRIDFGGIGKGYAEDEMMKVLQAHGINAAIIEGGGNIVISDAPPLLHANTANGWKVIINHKEYYLSNCGVSTSGDLYQFVEIDGLKYSHIVDPKTGIGVTVPRQLSIISADGTSSDWLSTALYLMKKKAGKKLARRMKARIIE